MSLFLHLSDLHLGRVKDADIPDDFKSDIVPLEQRLSRQKLLKDTLSQLHITLRRPDPLDAIIVSGDITVANDQEGFEMFEDVLQSLGILRPAPSNIVVVPGNHDVAWETTDPALKYKNFRTFIRDKGYVTPLLEGIDLRDGKIISSDLSGHYLLDKQHNWAFVPVNSSDLCGSLEPLAAIPEAVWQNLAVEIAGKDSKLSKEEIGRELRKLRLRDIARISNPDQLNAIRDIPNAIRLMAGASISPVLFAVLHHHLLPVSIREEFKPFESITNLGHLRLVLRDNQYTGVFHGHKHAASFYYDYITNLRGDIDSPHRVFVVSAPAVKKPTASPEVICRAVEFVGGSFAPTLAIQDISTVETGTNAALSPAHYFQIWQLPGNDEISSIKIIEGDSVEIVYQRVLALFEGRSKSSLLPNVICRVRQAGSPVPLPRTYPPVPDVRDEEREAWFRKIVDWWQKSDFKKLRGDQQFNHGHRIYQYERDVDQLDRVTKSIAQSRKTTRGVVTLLRPRIDQLDDKSSRFPSFCLAQFILREHDNSWSLEVIAFFRKQEFRYWWPVNIAELAELQANVFNKVKAEVEAEEKKPLYAGIITTIAATGHVGNEVPDILVPPVDVDLEESPHELWDMTYSLCWPEMKDRSLQVQTWKRVLADLIPPKHQDPAGVPVPVQGIEYLSEIAGHFGRNHGGPVMKVAGKWAELARINRQHAKRLEETRGRITEHVHNDWRSDVLLSLNEIREIVAGALGGDIEELT